MSEFHGRTGPGGTGWRASLAFFDAWLMNWERISAYDGGWCEWRRDPDNPVVRRVASPGTACHQADILVR